jgi:hypothetical protein
MLSLVSPLGLIYLIANRVAYEPQKTAFFIVTAAKISNLKRKRFLKNDFGTA